MDKQGEIAKIDRELEFRAAWRRRFPPGNQEAAVNIAELIDDSGYCSLDPDKIKPALVAQINFIFYKLGVIHVYNLERFAAAILSIANDDDLLAQRREILLKEDDHAE
jgi:hypothetical protein